MRKTVRVLCTIAFAIVPVTVAFAGTVPTNPEQPTPYVNPPAVSSTPTISIPVPVSDGAGGGELSSGGTVTAGSAQAVAAVGGSLGSLASAGGGGGASIPPLSPAQVQAAVSILTVMVARGIPNAQAALDAVLAEADQ